MNDNTAKLLEQLAHKLGTTAQYLWGVLLRQAPISATTSVVGILISIFFLFLVWKLHKYFSKKRGEDKYNESLYESVGDGLGITMIITTLVAVIFFICCICEIPNIVKGYFNPEYWALEQILDKLK